MDAETINRLNELISQGYVEGEKFYISDTLDCFFMEKNVTDFIFFALNHNTNQWREIKSADLVFDNLNKYRV